MTEREQTQQDAYRQARAAFDELKLEDRALFLIEAAAATIGRGLEQAGLALAGLLDALCQTGSREAGEAETPGQTARRRASRTTAKGKKTSGEDDRAN
ncbi:hypothetical protein GQ464_001755 [Rhodocaloribacter litoris]|uniref:hypothetical protein n=1 Tax=Rhodocaloribacter litoris TaxID=2558931 RepID=UPI00141D8CF8|nr:hypothetical protein [Rhodocaloribacter litoris]QXD15694.1 hypothetical protein GQ464_001755 [Rhodocaloribacter litoris]GIV61630.1 MAG: hypothetical protein KatS3mg044_0496 [Rhodothermaceae bacterium]